jgi:hypothetical protein
MPCSQGKKPGASFYNLDDVSSSNEGENLGDNASSPSPSLPPTKRKCTKSAGPSMSNVSKSHCVSAGQGMSEMATSLASMVKAIKKKRAPKMQRALTPLPKLLQDPLERAIVTLEVDTAFSDDETMDIIDVFMANQAITRVYATLQTSQVCTNLVKCHLAKLRGESV